MNEQKTHLSVYQVLTALLLASILNLNIFRIVLRTSSNMISYPIFALFFILILIQNGKRTHFELNIPVAAAIFLYIAWSIVSLFMFGGSYLREFIKFLICLVVGYLAGFTDRDTKNAAFSFSIILSALYSIYAIVYHNDIFRALIRNGSENYLTVTIPIGLGLTISLISLITEKESMTRRLICVSAALIQTFGLLNYSARGNLIFPFLVAGAFLVYESRSDLKSLLRNTLIILAGTAIAYYLFRNYASDKLVTRLTRLVSSVEQEGRVPIYRLFISDLWNNMRFLIGIGFGRSAELLKNNGFSELYPHNFILELVCEGGIFGVFLVIATLFEVIKAEKTIVWSVRNNHLVNDNKNSRTVYLTTSVLFFFILNYFKSYSIYDGYQMFICIAMILHSETLFEKDRLTVS